MHPFSLYFTDNVADNDDNRQNTTVITAIAENRTRERYLSSLYNDDRNQSIFIHNPIRQKILQQNFSDQADNVRLISMSRFHPSDHNDCILATEIINDNNNHHQQTISTLNQIHQQQRNHRSTTQSLSSTISTLSYHSSHHNHCKNIPIESKFFLINLIRNVFYMPSTIPKKRKFLSAITLLILVSIFCLISSSLVNVLISSSSSTSTSSSSALQHSSSSLFPYLAKGNHNLITFFFF